MLLRTHKLTTHNTLRAQEGELPVFEVTLVPEPGADDDTNHVAVAMRIAYTPTYPEAAPEISLRVVKRGGLADEAVAECEASLRELSLSDECLGTAMVYALAERTQEFLLEHNKPEMDMHAEMMARLAAQAPAEAADDSEEEEAAEQDTTLRGRRKRAIAADKKKAGESTWRADPANRPLADNDSYTPVTKENFAVYRKAWDEQRAAAAIARREKEKKRGGSAVAADEGLTGRQLFERSGAALTMEDAGELDEGEEDVMSAPRLAVDDDDEGGEARGGESPPPGGAAGGGEASLLDEVGDEGLFDDDEELPDD